MSMDLIDAHLNVGWLRPESALCDAIASERLSHYPLPRPSLDMGCGNGIFSFITAGGRLSRDCDCVIIYPSHTFDHGCDRVKDIPDWLRFYSALTIADANKPWPYPEESLDGVFSNMLYWLNSPDHAFTELWRALSVGGKALLTLQNTRIESYQFGWPLLDCGRSTSYRWRFNRRDLISFAKAHGFRVLDHRYYLSPLIIKVWDVGTRPLIKPLTHMVSFLNDARRAIIKAEWIETVKPFLEELYAMEPERPERGGHHLIYLEKK